MGEESVREKSRRWLSEGPRRTEGWLSSIFALAGSVILLFESEGATVPGALSSIGLTLAAGAIGGVVYARRRASAIESNPGRYAKAFEARRELAGSSLLDTARAALRRGVSGASPALDPGTTIALVVFVVLVLLAIGSLPAWLPGAFAPPGTLLLCASAFYGGSFLASGRVLRRAGESL